MKKQKIALLGIAALSVVALASCGGDAAKTNNPKTPTTPKTNTPTVNPTGQKSVVDDFTSLDITYAADTKGLDLAIHYNGAQGMTYRGETGIVNPVDNESYNKGKILPVWKEYSNTIKSEFREANNYSSTTDAALLTQFDTANFVSATDSSKIVDVVMGDVKGINNLGKAGKLVDLSKELDNMPYFKYFLEHNPSIKASITSNGGIYYTPYFDGYNAIERMFLMDTTMIKNLLDSADGAGDTAQSGKNAAANTLQANKYTPFIDKDYNYSADTTVKISKDGKLQEITIKKTDNIIKQQNNLLKDGCTGKQLLDQFKAYLKAAFGSNYKKLSDIFASESAAYNTDEMVALMRVVKANPGVATGGDADAEIEIMVPRQAANNRVDNMADLMEIFGVGMDSETSLYFFDGAGKINDAASLVSTYDAVERLSQLYDEGLILPNFWLSNPTQKNYLGQYFGKTTDNPGYGFMMYDYSASTTAMDSKDTDGIGTDDATRKGAFKDTKMEGFTPVLPPLTYWTTKEVTEAAANAHLGTAEDRAVKELIRYSDSNRALKSSSWAIPEATDNKEKALQLLDFLYSKRGQMINDFGPETYWESKTQLGTYGGKATPKFSEKLKEYFTQSSLDFWTFMRGNIGATMGIGYVRSASINYLATNKWGKIGTMNLETAIGSGAVTLALVDNPDASKLWANSVPTTGYGSAQEISTFAAVTDFWSSDKCATATKGWVSVVAANSDSISDELSCGTGDTAGAFTYGQVLAQSKTTRRENFLYETVITLGEKYVPVYA